MSFNCVRISNVLIIILILVLSIPVVVAADSHELSFTNNCNQPVWVNVQGGPPGTCDVPPAQNIDPSTGTNLKCSACSLCPDGSLCNTSVSTGASLPMCCPLITDPPVCWGGQACSKDGCCPGIPQTAGQTYGCPGVNTTTANCANTSMSFEQIAALSGYNNSTSGRQRATCSGSIIGGGGFKLEANGGTESYPVNDGWQGAWFGRTNCSFSNGLGNCETGNCLGSDLWGHLQCGGVGSTAPATKGEMNMDLATGNDFYDVSLVDGYNLPMKITPRDYNPAYVAANPADTFRCTSAGCLNTSTLSSCPANLSYLPNGNLVGCQDDCSLYTNLHNANPLQFPQANVDAYCCPDTTYCSPLNPCQAGSTCAAWITNPSTCLNCNAYNGTFPNGYPITILPNSALFFHASCPNAYSFTYDDASASYTCNSTPSTGLRTKYDITFCAQSSAPVAAFTGTPTSGTAPMTVTFTDTSTGSPTSWNWNFGDGGTSTSQNPSHTYTSAGIYTVSLTATNSAGSNTLPRTNYITVTSPTTTSSTIGIFRSGKFYLASSNTNGGLPVNAFNFGQAGDIPTAGDWNADGYAEVGIFRSGNFFLASSNTPGGGTVNAFNYGQAGDKPVAGDWNGDGTTTVGIFRSGNFFLASSNTPGGGTVNAFNFGQAGDIPVAGDWNGDGTTTVGIFRNGLFALASHNFPGGALPTYYVFGQAGDVPVTGDWNADGKTEVGVFRNGMVYQATSTGSLYNYFYYGMANDLPIGGYFGGVVT